MKAGVDIGETGILERLRKIFPRPRGAVVGIGDDAAVLPYDATRYLLLTVDTLVEGTDFRWAGSRPQAVGWKTLCISLSDIAAMGGNPLAAVISLGFPRGTSYARVAEFHRGIKKAAKRWKVAIVGGDLSRSPVFFATATVLGWVEKKRLVLRNGAARGDSIFVTGSLGGSILGKHLAFQPRIREARFLVERYKINAMIDISDGLIKDLGCLLRESGKGAQIYLNRIPVSQAARQWSRRTKKDPLESALAGGEDFELLFTVSPRVAKTVMALRHGLAGTRVTRIGQVTSGTRLIFHRTEKTKRAVRVPWKGFEHF